MPRCEVIKSVRYKTSEKAQKIPCNGSPKCLRAMRRTGFTDAFDVIVECDADERGNPMGIGIAKIRITTAPVSVRDESTSRILSIIRDGDKTYYAYEVEARRSARDWQYARLAGGFQIVNVGSAKVNLKCPIRIKDNAPHLVYRADLRKTGEPFIVAYINLKGNVDSIRRDTERAEELVRNGRLVRCIEMVPNDHALYLDVLVV